MHHYNLIAPKKKNISQKDKYTYKVIHIPQTKYIYIYIYMYINRFMRTTLPFNIHTMGGLQSGHS